MVIVNSSRQLKVAERVGGGKVLGAMVGSCHSICNERKTRIKI